jgi:hypothetical protein
MDVDHAGQTLLRCDVYDHDHAGMRALFDISY